MALGLSACQSGRSGSYDALEHSYASVLDPSDSLGWPMKVRSLSSDPYTFWRGSRELFWIWCKSNCDQWVSNAGATMPCHGDPHVGNIGSYMSGGFGKLAYGMVDFDDSQRLAVQYELLQGVITFRLIAQQNGVELSDADATSMVREMISAYASAAKSGRSATELVGDDPVVAKLLRAKGEYAKIVEELTENGRFRDVIRKKSGEVKEILRPADERMDVSVAVMTQAIARSPVRFRVKPNESDVRAAVVDVAQRTRLGSSGSQGLKKIFVLMKQPLVGVDEDVVIYLKQQVHSAAERTGFIPIDPRDPAERCADVVAALTDPNPYLSSWGAAGGESYWVTVKEPWSEELEFEKIDSLAKLRHYARIWATTTGASHRGKGDAIEAAVMDVGLGESLVRLSQAYGVEVNRQFREFSRDARTRRALQEADRSIGSASLARD